MAEGSCSFVALVLREKRREFLRSIEPSKTKKIFYRLLEVDFLGYASKSIFAIPQTPKITGGGFDDIKSAL